jgi:hypothetical protein
LRSGQFTERAGTAERGSFTNDGTRILHGDDAETAGLNHTYNCKMLWGRGWREGGAGVRITTPRGADPALPA